MGRSHRGSRSDAEKSEIQKLKHENQKLKKHISKLRKELSRIDIDRYSHLKDIIEAQDSEVKGFDKEHELRELKEKWLCHKCSRDHMRIILVPRADGTFYLRKCGTCDNRTKLKRFDNGVDGLDSNDKLVKFSES